MGDKKEYLGCTKCGKPEIDRRDVWKDEYDIERVTYICKCGRGMYVTYYAESPNVFELTEEIEENFR